MVTRDGALRLADAQIKKVILSGDPEISALAGDDPGRIALAAMRARERLADQIMEEQNVMAEPTRQRRLSEEEAKRLEADPGSVCALAKQHGIDDARLERDQFGPFIIGVPMGSPVQSGEAPGMPDFDAMTKERIEQFVMVNFGVNLNTRMTKVAMIAEAERLVKGRKRMMDFENALSHLKAGHKVARIGWNGKGMWLILVPGTENARLVHDSPYAKAVDKLNVTIDPHIDMMTAQGTMQPGWLASQADLLAEDWEVLD